MNMELRLSQFGDLLTIKDLCEIFSISKQTVYKEIKSGKFGIPLKFGREYRIPKIYIIERYLQGYAV